VLTAFDVDVAAAEQDIERLEDAVEEAVRGRVDGANAVEFGPDEDRTFLAHGAFEVALAFLLRAARNFGALLAEMKVG
jgi:hypothetical protein